MTSPPAGVKLHGVGQKVEQDALEHAFIGPQRRKIAVDVGPQPQSRRRGAFVDQPHRRPDRPLYVDLFLVDLRLAGFDLGKIEDVVD